MTYYAVIDTNVLVSALLHWDSNPGSIIIESLTGRIIPLLNEEILSEYQEVLKRPKFHFPQKAVDTVLNGIISRSIFLDSGPIEESLPDPKDIIFYEIVMEAKKSFDAYLVTGNLKHFPAKPFIVTPKEMLDILESCSH